MSDQVYTVGVEYPIMVYGYVTVRAQSPQEAIEKAIEMADDDGGYGNQYEDEGLIEWTGWGNGEPGPTHVESICEGHKPVVRGGQNPLPVPINNRERTAWVEIAQRFPALLDPESAVSGADLVEFLAQRVRAELGR